MRSTLLVALVALVALAAGCKREEPSRGRPTTTTLATVATAAAVPVPVPGAGGPFAYTIDVTDPRGELAGEHEKLKACVASALDQWGEYVTGKGVLTVDIRVQYATAGRLTSASGSGVVAGACKTEPAPCTLAQDQSTHRLRTGLDNPGTPNADVLVYVTPEHWRRVLWMDPDPKARTAPVPRDRDDAISVCTHEIGHGLGLDGYRDVSTYRPKPQSGRVYLSPYDELLRFAGNPTFEGPKTLAEVGPVPLSHEHTTEDLYHYGNASTPTPYDDRLMNGVRFTMGRRYYISRVDVLMLEDVGVPIRALPSR